MFLPELLVKWLELQLVRIERSNTNYCLIIGRRCMSASAPKDGIILHIVLIWWNARFDIWSVFLSLKSWINSLQDPLPLMEAIIRDGGERKVKELPSATFLTSPSCSPFSHTQPQHCLFHRYQRRKRQGSAFWCDCTRWIILDFCIVVWGWKIIHQ